MECVIHLQGSPVNIPDTKVSSPYEVNNLIHNLNARSISSQTYAVHNSVEQTVKEVEGILKSNPNLPRLTRGEILDLLENITKTDSVKVNAYQDLRDPKAIMVVMPFTPSNDANNMEELYTKPPVTHLIDAEPSFQKTPSSTTQKPIFRRKRPTKVSTTTTTEATTTTTSDKLLSHAQSQKKGNVRRRRPVTVKTTTPTTTTVRTSTYTSRTRSPVRRRPVSTTVQYDNHQYPEELLDFTQEHQVPDSGLRIVNAPQFTFNDNTNEDLSDLYLQEDNVKEIYHKPHSSIPSGFTSNNNAGGYKRSTTPPALIDEFNIPDNLKPVFTGMNLNAALDDPPKRKPVEIEKPQNINDVAKINELLASMGMYFPTTLPPTSTSSRMPDVKNVADNLTPEMKDLLMSFGLIPNPIGNAVKSTKSENSYYYPPSKPEIDHDAYVSFKPLPEDHSKRSEMDELLATYGLRTTRNQKSLKNKNDDNGNRLNFDMVPDSLKHVLDDIGLRDIKEESNSNSSLEESESIPAEKHVFKPMESEYATEEEMEKLEKLLGLVRSLEKLNRTVTEDDLKKVDIENIKELVKDLKTEKPLVPLDEQKNSPNPLHYDNGLSKNEVKRQESTTTAKAVTSTTTEEPKTPSIKDLEDSFGGQSETVSETVVETTTEAKKTGFYYLVDWNTFLDIDNQKGKRVNLRFQPTIGNPKNFLSVKVP